MTNEQNQRIIDESNYAIQLPQEKGPAAVGKGGDPFFRNIVASKEQLINLIEETQVVQDWIQRENSNNAAIAFLEKENLREAYDTIKNGFGNYGKILLMGFKTPTGVEIPRLKIYSPEGDVLDIISGPMVSEEINRRINEYNDISQSYEQVEEVLEDNDAIINSEISEYSG